MEKWSGVRNGCSLSVGCLFLSLEWLRVAQSDIVVSVRSFFCKTLFDPSAPSLC